jgi:hypothetical protein
LLQRITKIVFALAGALFGLALVGALSLAVWVMTGPKSLTKLMPYIEASLNPPESPYKLTLEDALVFWDGWSQPIDFRLRGVSLRLPGEGELLKLNEISVGLDIPSLMRLKIVPETLILRSPKMRFFREEDGQFYAGIGEGSQRVPLTLLLGGMQGENNHQSGALIGNIHLIAIENAHMSLGTPGQESLFDTDDANLRIFREEKAIRAELDIALHYGEKPSQITGAVRISNQQDMVVAKMELLDISPHMFARLVPEVPELATLQLPLSGWSDIAIDKDGNVTLVDFALQSNEGTFTQDTHFAEPLHITKASFEGQMRHNFTQFMLKKAQVHFGETVLTVNGIAQQPDSVSGWTYDAAAEVQNMPVNDLYRYWPKNLGTTSYQWVTTHIREGMVPKATARLKRTAGQTQEPFPESALAAQVDVIGAQVEYLPGHPKLRNVNGSVAFTGNSMTISADSGAMLGGTTLKTAWLNMPDMRNSSPPVHIKISADAPASDVATYLSIPALGFAQPLGLDPETIAGTSSAEMEFHFILPTKQRTDKNPQLTFDINAEVKEGAQPDFMGDKHLTAADGKLHITQDVLTYQGTMALSNAPLNVELRHSFVPQEFPTEYKANGVVAVPQLTVFGLPDMPFLMGNVGVSATILRNSAVNRVTALADLTQVAANKPDIGLTKKAGSKAQLKIEADIAEGALALKSFALTGDELRANGSAALKDNMRQLEMLRFDTLEFGDNNFAMVVESMGSNGYKIRAKGPSLDLKPFFADSQPDEQPQPVAEAESYKLPFPVDFHGEFDWIVVAKERELRNVNARFNCTPDLCEDVDFRGITGQSNQFVYQIKRLDGVRELNFTAQNAGSFLKAMDVFDNMQGGALQVRGRFNDNAPDKPFRGTVHISEHTITNAPVLAKIASLLSLSGIGDALGGKGITLKSIDGDVGYSKGLITVKNGKGYGPSLGLTVEDGIINTNTKAVSVTGTFIPSYTLNTALDNIPLIGEALSGGKGEGVFAATYKVEGAYPDKTEVSVNTLSMLAPGFLRNVVGAGADKASPEAAAPAPASPPAATPAPQAN